MRFNCVITFRSARSTTISTWKSKVQGKDHSTVAADMIAQLRKRQRRPLVIVGVTVYDRDAVV
jgi:CO dehydrogenase/acetyl-CoA synthase epsilon subunit